MDEFITQWYHQFTHREIELALQRMEEEFQDDARSVFSDNRSVLTQPTQLTNTSKPSMRSGKAFSQLPLKMLHKQQQLLNGTDNDGKVTPEGNLSGGVPANPETSAALGAGSLPSHSLGNSPMGPRALQPLQHRSLCSRTRLCLHLSRTFSLVLLFPYFALFLSHCLTRSVSSLLSESFFLFLPISPRALSSTEYRYRE